MDNLAPPEAVLTDRVVRSTQECAATSPVRVCAAGRGPATAALRPRGLRPRPLAHVASHDRSGYLARVLARILSDEPGQLLTAISSADVGTVRIDGFARALQHPAIRRLMRSARYGNW